MAQMGNWRGIYTRLQGGQYTPKTAIVLSSISALLVMILGYAIGFVVDASGAVFPQMSDASGMTESSNLNLIWGVHATVISLIIVALSVAWDSISKFPTSPKIIKEIARRLHSIEAATFLLMSNLLIGVNIFFISGEKVSTEIVVSVAVLIIVSFGVVIRQIWNVLGLVLYNTLDETVSEYAYDALDRQPGDIGQRYNTYISHFFQSAHQSIETDNPEQLLSILLKVEDLIDNALWNDSVFELGEIWENILNNYDSLHRRSVRQQNEKLEERVVRSLSRIFSITIDYRKTDLTINTLLIYPKMLERSLRSSSNISIGFLIKRFETSRDTILHQFEDASSDSALEEVSDIIDVMIDVHASLLKTAIECESIDDFNHLHHLASDVYQFRPYEYMPPLPQEDEDETEDEFDRRKQKKADEYRNELTQLRFISYARVLHLNIEEKVSDDFLIYILNEAFTDDPNSKLESGFESVDELSEIYSRFFEEDEILRYWEGRNMESKLEDSYDAATTGMAMDTWLLRFYCVAMISVLQDEENIDYLKEKDPKKSSFTELDEVPIQLRVEKIIRTLNSYKQEFPIDEEFLPGSESVGERCECLIKYFEGIKSGVEKEEQKEVRELPIYDDAVRRFERKVNSQLDNCGLRSGIKEIHGITSFDTVERGKDEFQLVGTSARRAFVETSVPTYFSSNFSRVLEGYRDFVLNQLNMREQEIKSAKELPDALGNITSREEVGVFVVESKNATNILSEDERSERTPLGGGVGFYNFVDVPVIRDLTDRYAAVVLFSDGLEYEEAEPPISVSVKRGEEVEEWSGEDMPDGKVPADFVQITYSYQANIQTPGKNGVVIRISD